MIEKYKLSISEIEKDIISSIKYHPDESRRSYNIWRIIAVIIALIMAVFTVVNPRLIIWMVIAAVVLTIVSIIAEIIMAHLRIKNVSVSDYEIKCDSVSHKSDETYRKRYSQYNSRTINNYTICFTDSGEWRVPKQNYLWLGEYSKSDFSVFENTHRDDGYIVVVNKSTGKIAVAYSLNMFEYKD